MWFVEAHHPTQIEEKGEQRTNCAPAIARREILRNDSEIEIRCGNNRDKFALSTDIGNPEPHRVTPT